MNRLISKVQCSRRGNRRLAATTAFVVALSAATVFACQVPVFRYALEHWNADRYRITILHDKPLDESQSTALARLKQSAEAVQNSAASVKVQLLNVNDKNKISPAMMATWKSRKDASAPLLLVDYPLANDVPRKEPMFHGPLTQLGVDSVLSSPVRIKVAQRLAAGDSAVWIFVPCGRNADDTAALERLKTQVRADEASLKLPSAKALEVTREVLEQLKVPLKIRFSTVTLNRDDPAEEFLLQSLLNSEEDLVDFDQPLAFPVFGRGRVLYALVGKGITGDTVRSTSAFLAGACSCQVKNQNPGFDLLLPFDWKKTLGDVLISEPIKTVDAGAKAPRLLTIPPGRNAKKK